MKKSKAFLSLISILACAAVMFSVFSSSSFKNTAAADVKLIGVDGKLKAFGEKLIEAIYETEKADYSENQNINPRIDEQELVYLGGYPVGLKLYADGVVIVGTEAVDTEQGNINPAEKAGLKVGDVIKTINGIKVDSNYMVSDFIEHSNGQELEIEVAREDESLTVVFSGAFSVSEQKYKAGLWIRDSSAGIGTVTFCTQNGCFASLGHAVCDIDTKMVLPVLSGECTDVNITGIIKGNSGKTGEMCGILEGKGTGQVLYNGDLGVYGKFNYANVTQLYPIAEANEIETGEAKIYTTLEDGIIEEYDIKILRIDRNVYSFFDLKGE